MASEPGASSRTLPVAALVALAVSLAWNTAWIFRTDAPWDWDPSYYLGVARNIAEGRGAVTDAVWNLGWLPPALVHPADLHWMPLPSRWLVPFLFLPVEPYRAAQLATVVAGSSWALVGYGWARTLGMTGALAALAGVAAGTGGGYTGYLSLPDSLALYGAVGGLALLASARGWFGVTLAALTAASLCRSDGFFLALACALAWPARRAVVVAAVGPVVTGVWSLRSLLLVGEGAVQLRARAMQALDPAEWLIPGGGAPPGVGERLAFLGEHAEAIVRTWLVPPLVLGMVPLLYGAWRARSTGRTGPALLYALVLPPLLYVLAPAVAFEGSAFRSLAAVWPCAAALLVLGASSVTRRYPAPMLPGITVLFLLVLASAAARAPSRFPPPLDDCGVLRDHAVPAGAPLLSYDPIGVSARCRHPGVILGRAATPAEIDALADRYGIEWVLTAPDGYESWTMESAGMTAPGWEKQDDRLWRRTSGSP